MTRQIGDRIQKAAARMGITYSYWLESAILEPATGESRYALPTFKWRVRLERSGKEIIVSPFTNHQLVSLKGETIQYQLTTGKVASRDPWEQSHLRVKGEWWPYVRHSVTSEGFKVSYHGYGFKHSTLMAKVPTLVDVIWVLFSDAGCAYDSFEEFCDELGYNSDSRKALETYMACQKTRRKLRKGFTQREYSLLAGLSNQY